MSRSLAFTSRGARESRAKASEDAKGACVTMGSRISSIMESVNDPALREDPQLRSVVLELQRALGVIDPLLDKVERRLATSGESDRPEALNLAERSPTVVAGVSPGGTEDGFSPTKVLAAVVAENSGYAYHVTKESEKELERTREGRTAVSSNNRSGEETGDGAAAKVVTETGREQNKHQVSKEPERLVFDAGPPHGVGDYVGDVSGGKPHGKGTMEWPTGKKYRGDWKNGKRHGNGWQVWKDGRTFDGQWENGRPHGLGKWTSPQGECYEGELFRGKKQGKGIFMYPDGKRYEGEWHSGVREGQGTRYYPDGSTYVGSWKNDRRNGQGTYRALDGQVWSGTWVDGNPLRREGSRSDGEGLASTSQHINRDSSGILDIVISNSSCQSAASDVNISLVSEAEAPRSHLNLRVSASASTDVQTAGLSSRGEDGYLSVRGSEPETGSEPMAGSGSGSVQGPERVRSTTPVEHGKDQDVQAEEIEQRAAPSTLAGAATGSELGRSSGPGADQPRAGVKAKRGAEKANESFSTQASAAGTEAPAAGRGKGLLGGAARIGQWGSTRVLSTVGKRHHRDGTQSRDSSQPPERAKSSTRGTKSGRVGGESQRQGARNKHKTKDWGPRARSLSRGRRFNRSDSSSTDDSLSGSGAMIARPKVRSPDKNTSRPARSIPRDNSLPVETRSKLERSHPGSRRKKGQQKGDNQDEERIIVDDDDDDDGGGGGGGDNGGVRGGRGARPSHSTEQPPRVWNKFGVDRDALPLAKKSLPQKAPVDASNRHPRDSRVDRSKVTFNDVPDQGAPKDVGASTRGGRSDGRSEDTGGKDAGEVAGGAGGANDQSKGQATRHSSGREKDAPKRMITAASESRRVSLSNKERDHRRAMSRDSRYADRTDTSRKDLPIAGYSSGSWDRTRRRVSQESRATKAPANGAPNGYADVNQGNSASTRPALGGGDGGDERGGRGRERSPFSSEDKGFKGGDGHGDRGEDRGAASSRVTERSGSRGDGAKGSRYGEQVADNDSGSDSSGEEGLGQGESRLRPRPRKSRHEHTRSCDVVIMPPPERIRGKRPSRGRGNEGSSATRSKDNPELTDGAGGRVLDASGVKSHSSGEIRRINQGVSGDSLGGSRSQHSSRVSSEGSDTDMPGGDLMRTKHRRHKSGHQRIVSMKFNAGVPHNVGEYVGEIKGGLPDGQGTITWPTGRSYSGTWKDGKRTGHGTFFWEDGRRLEGGWYNNNAHGEGKFVFQDGTSYVGGFRDGLKHGHGVRRYPGGDTYDGQWRYGLRHGKGVCTSANGDRFEGNYVDDRKTGKGIYLWADGRKYIGGWQEGKQHGQGTLFAPDGRIIQQGRWKNGHKTRFL